MLKLCCPVAGRHGRASHPGKSCGWRRASSPTWPPRTILLLASCQLLLVLGLSHWSAASLPLPCLRSNHPLKVPGRCLTPHTALPAFRPAVVDGCPDDRGVEPCVWTRQRRLAGDIQPVAHRRCAASPQSPLPSPDGRGWGRSCSRVGSRKQRVCCSQRRVVLAGVRAGKCLLACCLASALHAHESPTGPLTLRLPRVAGQPLLVAFNAAGYAEQLEKKSKQAVKDEYMAVGVLLAWPGTSVLRQ